MRILLSLNHENIIDIKDFICEDTVDTLKDIYIIQVVFIGNFKVPFPQNFLDPVDFKSSYTLQLNIHSTWLMYEHN